MKDFKKYTIINNEDTKWIVITDKNIEKDSKWLGFRELLKTEDLPQRVTQDIIRNYPTYIIVDNQNETYARDLYHWVISQDIALCVQYTKTYIIKKGKEKKFENAMNECGAGYNNTGDSQVFLNKPISWSYTSWPITSRKILSSRRNNMTNDLITFDQYVQEKGFDNKTVNRFWKYCNQDIPNKEIGDIEWWGSEATNHNDMRGYPEEFDNLFEKFKNINSSRQIKSSWDDGIGKDNIRYELLWIYTHANWEYLQNITQVPEDDRYYTLADAIHDISYQFDSLEDIKSFLLTCKSYGFPNVDEKLAELETVNAKPVYKGSRSKKEHFWQNWFSKDDDALDRRQGLKDLYSDGYWELLDEVEDINDPKLLKIAPRLFYSAEDIRTFLLECARENLPGARDRLIKLNRLMGINSSRRNNMIKSNYYRIHYDDYRLPVGRIKDSVVIRASDEKSARDKFNKHCHYGATIDKVIECDEFGNDLIKSAYTRKDKAQEVEDSVFVVLKDGFEGEMSWDEAKKNKNNIVELYGMNTGAYLDVDTLDYPRDSRENDPLFKENPDLYQIENQVDVNYLLNDGRPYNVKDIYDRYVQDNGYYLGGFFYNFSYPEQPLFLTIDVIDSLFFDSGYDISFYNMNEVNEKLNFLKRYLQYPMCKKLYNIIIDYKNQLNNLKRDNMIKSAYTREDYDRFDEVGNFIPYQPTEEELAKKDEIKIVLRQELSDAYEPDPMDDYVGYDSTNERIDMACERVAKQFGVDTDFVEDIAGEIQNEDYARTMAESEWIYEHCTDKDKFWDWQNGEDVSLEELGIDKEQMNKEVNEMVNKYVNSSRKPIKSSTVTSDKQFRLIDTEHNDPKDGEDFTAEELKDYISKNDKYFDNVGLDYTIVDLNTGEEMNVSTFRLNSSRQIKSALDTVKVTFDNGDTIVTDYNADVGREEIAKYYMHNYFNVGGEDEMHQVVKVEFPGNINSARVPEKADLDMAYQLEGYIESDHAMYDQLIVPVIKNLERKMKRGIFDYDKSLILWQHVADEGAKRYVKELGGPSYNVATRKEVAKNLAEYYKENYDVNGDIYNPIN